VFVMVVATGCGSRPPAPEKPDEDPKGLAPYCGDLEGSCQQVVDRYLHDRAEANLKERELAKQCAQDHDRGVCWAANMFLADGAKVTTDPKRALAWFDTSCKAGDQPSCRAVAWIWYEGLVPTGTDASALPASLSQATTATAGTMTDILAARDLYQKACDGGDVRACVELGVTYERQVGFLRELDKSAALYDRACKAGDRLGCARHGQALVEGWGVTADPKAGVKQARAACDAGEMYGCFVVALAYQYGKGVATDQAKSLELNRKACDGGLMSGCVNQGFAYEQGRGAERDDTKAVQLYELSCDGGHPVGCSNLGSRYENGRGVGKDELRAAALYKDACDRKSGFGCKNLAWMYRNGRGVQKDAKRAVELFELGCNLGVSDACTGLAKSYIDGIDGVKDPDRGLSVLDSACNNAAPAACGELGWRLLFGTGVAPDVTRGFELTRKACDAEIQFACQNLGVAYERGLGVARDYAEANRRYELGCTKEFAASCLSRGLSFEHGRGERVDRVAAQSWYAKGCKLDDAGSCNNLAWLLMEGTGGVKRDLAEAKRLFQNVCDKGVGYGCHGLGVFYKKGHASNGTPDYAAALKEFQKGCDLGEAYACQQVGEIYSFGKLGTVEADKALEPYRKGCELGRPISCFALGTMYRDAHGTDADETKAGSMFERACKSDYVAGCVDLAWVLERGLGRPADPVAANATFAKLCRLNGSYCGFTALATQAEPATPFASRRLTGACPNERYLRVKPGTLVSSATAGGSFRAEVGGFEIGETEVTQCQYQKCVRAGRCTPPNAARAWPDARGALPVTGVSQTQAAAYCSYRKARLPTEVEWEFAARGSDLRSVPWRQYARPDCTHAVLDGECGSAPAPVGDRRAGKSPVGALDMLGNVQEWTADWFGERLAGQHDAHGPSRGSAIAVRGGSWHTRYQNTLRERTRLPQDYQGTDVGFRCVRDRK